MTLSSASSADDPREVLSGVKRVTWEVRLAQRATWFPLLLLAVVNIAAVPVYRFAPHHTGLCRSAGDGTQICAGYIPAVLVYWPVALVLAYAVVARYYLARARRRGVGARVRPYITVGVALAAVLGAASLWRAQHPRAVSAGQAAGAHPHMGVLDVATPAAAIGIALLVLAWVEANRLLGAFGVVYLAVVLVQAAHVIRSTSQWYFLPHLLVPAALLLLASAGFAAVRSGRRHE